MHTQSTTSFAIIQLLLTCLTFPAAGGEAVDYEQVAPIFTKYCAGCHNETDREGDFSLTSFNHLIEGTPDGPVTLAGKAEESKLWQLMAGRAEPKMPPEEEPAPSTQEIEMVRKWIAGGLLHGTTQLMPNSSLLATKLKPAAAQYHYVGAGCVIGGGVALGKLGRVEMRELDSMLNENPPRLGNILWTVSDLSGKVNSLRASDDGRWLIAGSGIAGLGGEIVLIDATTGAVLKRFAGHADSVYCAAVSPNGKWLASGSYDRKVILWDVESGQAIREFTGHNGAIYDLDFDPAGEVLATASADQTVKLWNVQSGDRLDTLGQPEGEMLCVRFDPSGEFVLAGGADKQIRKWRLVSRDQAAINPMLFARYAHESSVLRLAVLPGGVLLSTSDDRTVKAWTTDQLRPLGQVASLADTPVALSAVVTSAVALSSTSSPVHPQSSDPGPRDAAGAGNNELLGLVIELTGGVRMIARSAIDKQADKQSDVERDARSTEASHDVVASSTGTAVETLFSESEPNDALERANLVSIPAKITGKISPESRSADPGAALHPAEDVDLYRISAQAGEEWLLEIHAASHKSGPVSALDSRIDILDEQGLPVLRTRLQALRESYFTFRGKDSDTSDDFRLHKWEDMELDEYLYSSGEVTRLWLYPRGPDSGFKVYPGFGRRYTFLDTTPVSHALGEPAYIVKELAPEEAAVPNGLPVFPIYFQNDDDPLRRAGPDSRLSFVAPKSGDYLVRVRDARSFGGDDFQYELEIRRPRPDFSITVSTHKLSMPKGSGREWKVTATRLDGLNGPIAIHLEGLPEGFLATDPLIIEAEQDTAVGVIFATDQAVLTSSGSTSESAGSRGDEFEAASQPQTVSLKLTARAEYAGQEITHELEDEIELALVDQKEVQIRLYPANGSSQELTELTIHPGETVTAKVIVERNGTTSRIGFGNEDSGRNLPHGAYVDNIGLNGLLITEQNTEREFFITAAPKVQPGKRQFHLRSDTKDNPTSRPIWLTVLPRD